MSKVGSKTALSGPVRSLLVGALLVGTITMAMMTVALWGSVLAAPPIGGDPISVQGPTAIYSTSEGIIHAAVAADLDTDGHADIAFGQADLLRIKANVGITTTEWAQTVTVGSATYTIRDVHAVDIDRDGAIDLVSASADDAGNSQLHSWQNPTSPFTDLWAVSNTLTTSAISLTSVTSRDLDHNGTPDLVSGGLDGILRLWPNPLTGTQSFTTPWSSPATISTPGDQIRQVIVADIDRDGLPDIVEAAGDGSSGVVRLWQNPGDSFNTAWTVSNTLGTFTAAAHSIEVGDLDNNDTPDVVVGLSNGQVAAWSNPITGTQPFTTDWGASSLVGNLSLPVYGLAITDADHDGQLDVVATGSGTPSLMAAWRNTGQPFSGGWSQVTLGTPSDAIFVLTAADFNCDGDTDFVTATGNAGTNTGSLQFWTNALIRPSVRFRTHNVPNHTADALSGVGLHAMDVHDMNRDGRPDIVVATLDGSLMILQNNGSPFVSNWPTTTIGTAFGFFSVAADDLDGDGWPDIATSTTLTDTGGLVHIWRNDGTPFTGSWISQTAGTFPRQVMDLALGDVGREGHLQIVASTGITTTFDNRAEHTDIATSDDHRIWLLRPAAGDPFVSAWISSTVGATTYSANSVALGDLDNDGWLDIVFGTDHAPPSTSEDPEDWPDAYQVRAFRNLGDTYTPDGWQVYDIGRDPADVSIVYAAHRFWGAHVWSVAVSDFNNDGYLDVVSGGGAEGDHQILVYKNSGTPFDGNIWEPTAVGYGSVPGVDPEEEPWLEDAILSVNVGDLNGDGLTDIVSGFPGEVTVWLNSGISFGAFLTDTHWIRYNLGVFMRPVYGVAVTDFDNDGRPDLAAVDSWVPYDGDLRVWRNLGGIVRHDYQTDDSLTTIEDGATESRLSFGITHNGRHYDHDLGIDSLKVRLDGTYGFPLNNTTASALFQSLRIYRDANGDNVWQPSDSPVITITDFSLITNGHLTFTFPSGDPLAAISAGQTVTYFVVLNVQPTASQASVDSFRLHYTSHEALLVRDQVTQASVSLEEGAWTYTPEIWLVPAPAASVGMTAHPSTIWADGNSTSTITATVTTAYGYPVLDGEVVTFTTSAGVLPASPYYTNTTTNGTATAVLTSSTDLTVATVTGTASITATGTVTVTFGVGPRASLRVNDAPGLSGGEFTTHTMSADDTLTVYVAAYDSMGYFIDNPADVTWGGTGVASGNVSPTAGASATTFAPVLVGTGTITVADGSGHSDATGTITVTPGALAAFAVTSPSPQTAGQPFSVTVTAYDADSNVKTDYAGTVDFASSDLQAVLPTDDGSGWLNGAKDFTLELRTTGVQTYSVQDGSVTQDSAGITVNPSVLADFEVTAPSPQVAGTPFSVTVTARDEFDNLKTDYTGVISFTSSDPQAVLPTDDGSDWSNGAKDFTLELRTTGVQTYSVQDGAVTRESAGIMVNPGNLRRVVIRDTDGGGGHEVDTHTMTAGEKLTVWAAGYDGGDNYVGDVFVAWSGSGAVGGRLAPTGGVSTTFTAGPAGTGTIQADAGGGITDTTGTITVNLGALDHFAFATISEQEAGRPFTVTITAQDAHNNTVIGYTGPAALIDTTGTISPTTTGSFSDGVWTGQMTITQAQSGVVITAQDGSASGSSNSFDVNEVYKTYLPLVMHQR